MLERLIALRGLEEIKTHLERETAQCSFVQMSHQVSDAGKRQFMGLHPGQHFIDLTDLPALLRIAPVTEQGIGLIKDQERTAVAGFGKRLGNVALVFAHPF